MLGACVVLAGCAEERIALKPPPGPPAGVDGRYRGTVRLVRANDRSCPRSGPRLLQVSNGRIELSYNAGPRQRQVLATTVEGDGTIRASDGVGSVEGRVADGRLDLTIASATCEHHWSMVHVQ